MILKQNISSPDFLGVAASALCAVHCMATPFIFLAKACTDTCCTDAPLWWRLIDYLFLGISFAAIYYATKTSTKRWIKQALWFTWVVLLLTLLDEGIGMALLPEHFIYLPAGAIVVLHLYNQKYCQCADDKCCTELGKA